MFMILSKRLKIADHKKINEIYNLASGHETSVNYIANIIGGDTVKIPKRPGEPNRSLADITKIQKEINWKPSIKIEDGVRMMLKIIENWKEAPVWTPEKIEEATKPWFNYLKKERKK